MPPVRHVWRWLNRPANLKRGSRGLLSSLLRQQNRHSRAVSASSAVPEGVQKFAVVQVLTGPNAGKELELVKNLTTLGKPGLQVAVLTRRPHGYFITHVEGESFPLVNGQALTNQAHQLNEHDVIELAGIKMEFYFKG